MKNIIFGIIFGILSASYAASSCDFRLDLEAADCARPSTTPSVKPNPVLWSKFENFLKDRDFEERSVLSTLEAKFPEVSRVVPWMDCRQLLKTACHLKRLHFLSLPLKRAYENVFYSLEFSIETLNPEDTSRLWSCISGCGYRLSKEFIERLDFYTAKQSSNFSCPLVLSTLRHLSVLPAERAFRRFVPILSKIKTLRSPNDCHDFIFLKAYLAEVKGECVVPTRSMIAAIEKYQESAVYRVTTSLPQSEVASFLQDFDSRFTCEVFYKDLDTHLDIADEESKIVVDMDGHKHSKVDQTTTEHFRRPLDLMRDAILLGRGWKVYRIRPDEWEDFKKTYAAKMTERSTLEAFYKLYAVNA